MSEPDYEDIDFSECLRNCDDNEDEYTVYDEDGEWYYYDDDD